MVLALTVEDKHQYAASMSLVLLTLVGLAFSTVALIFGRDAVRSFGVGAAIPLACSCLWAATDTNSLIAALAEPADSGFADLTYAKRILGSAILASIAVGYLCVIFRWIIEPQSGNHP